MMRQTLYAALAAAVLAAGLAAPAAAEGRGKGRDDRPFGRGGFEVRSGYTADEARDARERGAVVPLRDVRESVRSRFPVRQFLDTELLTDPAGKPRVYRVRIVTTDGRLVDVDVDPRTGRVLGTRGR